MGIAVGRSSIGIPWYFVSGVATHHLDLPDNATTAVTVGGSATNIAVIINYCATRGANSQMGSVFILNDGGTTDFTWDYQDADIGITITSSIVATNIVMSVAVDNSSADNVTFNYIIELISA